MAHYTLIARINAGTGKFPFVNVQFSKNHRPIAIEGATYYLRPSNSGKRTPIRVGKDVAAAHTALIRVDYGQSLEQPIAAQRTSFGVSTRRLLRTLERHANRSLVEKHPLRATLRGTLKGDETIPSIPIDPVSVCVRNDAAASHIIGDSKCDLEDFGNERVPEAFARKSAVYRKGQQNQRQFVWRKAAHIFLWEGVPWHTCRRESEISNHAEWGPFIDRHISHTDGALLLIRPRMTKLFR